MELDIQRLNNLSKYTNVVDTWTLPKRRKITYAFTRRLAKPTSNGRLALIPSTQNFPFENRSIKNPYSYEINLPSDENFFRHLVMESFPFPTDDLRAAISRDAYVDLSISDKGQNLRGVIALFDHLGSAYDVFTRFIGIVRDIAIIVNAIYLISLIN